MESFTRADLQSIKEECTKHSQIISDLRDQLKDLLTQPSTPVARTQKPPLSTTRPVLLSRVDGIQSRLSQLAAALSPSSRSTPLNRARSASPNIRSARVVESVESSSSDEDEVGDVLFELSKDRISKSISRIEAKLASKMEELRQQRESIERVRVELMAQANEREKVHLAELIDAINNIDAQSCSRAPGMDDDFLNKELGRLRLESDRLIEGVRDQMSVEHLGAVFSELERLQGLVDDQNIQHETTLKSISMAAEQQISKALQDIKDHFANEIAQAKESVERSVVGPQSISSVNSGLVEENRELKKLVRRMKICLSKWRVDYLNHANEQRATRPVEESFTELAHTLGRMWIALPPSGNELADFLLRLDTAASSPCTITLSSVLRDECARQVEKLPLAEMAAQRQYLLTKRSLSSAELTTLASLTDNLVKLVSDYESKHNQTFCYDGRPYLTLLDRDRYRG